MSILTKPSKQWKILELLKVSADYLKEKCVPSSRLDAEVLLAFVLGLERIQLYTSFERVVADGELNTYRSLIARRGLLEPVAYLRNEKEFYSRPFYVNSSVLIPRPETEILVEEGIRWLEIYSTKKNSNSPRVLDIGTGSGCIAVTIANEISCAEIVATDCSTAALSVARENAKRLNVSSRISFFEGDLFEPIVGQVFDLVISNPPYVISGDSELSEEVCRYEPGLALYAGEDGCSFYRRLATGLKGILSSDGTALFEIGAGQDLEVKSIFEQAGFSFMDILPDLAGIARILRVSLVPLPEIPKKFMAEGLTYDVFSEPYLDGKEGFTSGSERESSREVDTVLVPFLTGLAPDDQKLYDAHPSSEAGVSPELEHMLDVYAEGDELEPDSADEI